MKVLDIGNKRKGYYLNGLKGRNRQNLRAKNLSNSYLLFIEVLEHCLGVSVC